MYIVIPAIKSIWEKIYKWFKKELNNESTKVESTTYYVMQDVSGRQQSDGQQSDGQQSGRQQSGRHKIKKKKLIRMRVIKRTKEVNNEL